MFRPGRPAPNTLSRARAGRVSGCTSSHFDTLVTGRMWRQASLPDSEGGFQPPGTRCGWSSGVSGSRDAPRQAAPSRRAGSLGSGARRMRAATRMWFVNPKSLGHIRGNFGSDECRKSLHIPPSENRRFPPVTPPFPLRSPSIVPPYILHASRVTFRSPIWRVSEGPRHSDHRAMSTSFRWLESGSGQRWQALLARIA